MSVYELFNRGVTLSLQGDHVGALEAFEAALELEARHPGALHARAILLVILGRPLDAVAAFAQAIDVQPGFAENHRQLGLAYLELGQVNEARAATMRALELQAGGAYRENAAVDVYNLGGQQMIRAAKLRDHGRTHEAASVMRLALGSFMLSAEVNPALQGAHAAVERVQRLLGL